MIRKLLQGLLALPVAAFCASTTNAAPISFQISGGAATPVGFAVGSTVSVTPSSGLTNPFALDLEGPPGAASHTIDFLDIAVSGTGLATGTIEASLNFESPVLGSATGLLVGLAVILDKFATGTVTVLTNPTPIAFGDGGLFGVTFEGFSATCLSCSALSGTVRATVSLLQAPRSVPEPATLTLLGAGLLALAVTSRTRRRRV